MQAQIDKLCANFDAALQPMSNRLAVVELRLATLATTFDQFRRSVNAERTEKRLKDLEQSMAIVANVLTLHRAAITVSIDQ